MMMPPRRPTIRNRRHNAKVFLGLEVFEFPHGLRRFGDEDVRPTHDTGCRCGKVGPHNVCAPIITRGSAG